MTRNISQSVLSFSLLWWSAAAVGQETPAAEPAADGEEAIVVTGQRASQKRAVEIKRSAPGVVDVAAADDIGQLPDRNVAEVVERLPGVGVQYDQGEGRYVSVRGIPSDLNQYTYNGFEIGNPDGNTRRLPLDVVSGQLLNRIEVFKVKTADQDGQGIGGLINLVPQTAFDFRTPHVVQINAQVGAQQIDGRHPIRGDVMAGGRFGRDGTLGLLVGASYSRRTFTSYGFFPDDWARVDAAARGALPINIKYSDYRLTRERLGLAGSFDFRPDGGDHRLWLRGLYSKFTEDEYRQRFRLDFANGDLDALIAGGQLVINPDGVTGFSTRTEQRNDLRLEYKEKSVLAGMVGGTSRVGLATVDYGLARVHNEVIEPNRLWQFRNASALGPVDFDFGDKLFTASARTPVPAANLQFRQYSEQDERGDEDIWQARFSVKHPLPVGDDSWFDVGVKGRWTDKRFDASNEVYNRGSAANRFTLVDAGAVGDPVRVKVEPDRVYLIPVTIDAGTIAAFTEGRLGSAQFVRNNASSLADEVLSDTDLDEHVYGAYAQANLDWGAFELTAGLRLEHTDLDITGFRLRDGATVERASERSSYDDLLPALIARYRASNGLVIRAAYSRSVGRPSYADLSPGGEVAVEGNDAFVELGNPALKPYVSDNLDASIEYYFGEGGLLSAGVFAKWIKNPIFSFSFSEIDREFAGTLYDSVSFSQPLNGRTARLRGVELAYSQQFTFLPGWLAGFGASANLTLIDSKLDYPDGAGTRSVPFPEQSDLLWGAQLFYQRGPVEASIAYHHTGRALLSPGAIPDEDQYNDDLRRLDAKASFRVREGLSFFVEGQNLTDEPTRQYQGGNRDWVIQHERYGRAVWLGASVTL